MGVLKKYNNWTGQWEAFSSGEKGYTGSRGDTGYAGSVGYAGSSGYAGSQGIPGTFAALGYTGSASTVIGFTGSVGYTGSIGYTGSSGYAGSQGFTGYTGSTPSLSAYVTLTGTETLTNKTMTSVDTASSIKDSSGNSYSIGYRQMPQNTQSTTYTLVNSDEGKHIYYTGATATITIPADGSTTGGNFDLGSVVTIINHGSGNVTISHSGSLFFAGNTTSASRVISPKGIATVIKVASNVWYISGGGVV